MLAEPWKQYKHACSVCNQKFTTRAEAEKHSEIPVADQKIPVGLVYYASSENALWYEIVISEFTDWHHEPAYEVLLAELVENTRANSGRIYCQDELLGQFKKGIYCFLSDSEFLRFQENHRSTLGRIRMEARLGELVSRFEA